MPAFLAGVAVACCSVALVGATARAATSQTPNVLDVKVCTSDLLYPMADVSVTLNPLGAALADDVATLTWSVVGTQQNCTLPALEYSLGAYGPADVTPGASTPYATSLQATLADIAQGVQFTAPSTTIRFRVTARKLADPTQTALSNEVTATIAVTAPSAPTLDAVTSPTNSTAITVTGDKPANTGIVHDGTLVVPVSASTEWTATVTVPKGTRDDPATTTLAFAARTEHRVASAEVTTTVTVPVKRPTITSSTESTAESTYALACGKAAHTGVKLRVNSGSWVTVAEVSSETTCSTAIALQAGSNTLELRAFTTSGEQSEARTATISRTSLTGGGGAVAPPSVTPVVSPRRSATFTVSGTKPAGTAILEHDVELVPASGSTSWSASVTVPAGLPTSPLDSPLYFRARDSGGATSSVVTVVVTVPIGKPTGSFPAATTSDRVSFTCTKPANTGVKVTVGTTSSVVAPVGSTTTCSGTVPLAVGANTVSLQAFNRLNEVSETASFSVTRTSATDGAAPVCGNGRVETGEQCEPPRTATCSWTCQRIGTSAPSSSTPPTGAVCGNGRVETGEQCEPPRTATCSWTCQRLGTTGTTTTTGTAPVCGNGKVEAGEQCEPPRTATCSWTCQRLGAASTAPVCGNGRVEAGEQCEPPRTATCSWTCQRIGAASPTSSAPPPSSSAPPSAPPPSLPPTQTFWTSPTVPATDPLNPLPALEEDDAEQEAFDAWVQKYFGAEPVLPTVEVLGSRDSDSDGLSDLQEYELQSHPLKGSSAGDGIMDGVKVFLYHADPLRPLTDEQKARLRITNLQTGLKISDPSPLLVGTGPADATVTFTATDAKKVVTQLGVTDVDPLGFFSFRTDKELSDGTYTFTVSATVDGKPVTASVPGVVIDAKLGIAAPTPQKLDAQEIPPTLSDVRLVTSNSRPVVVGRVNSAVKGVTVQGYWRSFVNASSVISGSATGDFSLTAPVALAVGEHTVTVYATTPDGVRSRAVVLPFSVTEQSLLAADLGAASGGGGGASATTALVSVVSTLLAGGGAEIARRKGLWTLPPFWKRRKKDEAGDGIPPPLS